MNIKVKNWRNFMLWGVDLFFVVFSYIIALDLRFDFNVENTYFNILVKIIPIILIVTLIVFNFFKINRSLWEFVSIEEAVRLFVAILLSNSILLFIYNFYIISGFPRTVFITAAILESVSMLGMRVLYRYLRLQKRSSDKSTNALIIGAGSGGNILSKEIMSNKMYKSKVVGFIDDNNQKLNKLVNNIEVLGTTNDLKEIIDKKNIDEIFIAIPSADKETLRTIIHSCEDCKIPFKTMGLIEDIIDNKPSLREVSIDDLLGRGEIKLDTCEINTYLKNKTVMVTGGGGSIGSELCRQILNFKPKLLVVFDIYENNMYAIQQEVIMKQRKGLIDPEIKLLCIIGSVRDKDRLDHIIGKYNPSVVFHAAAHKHVPLVEDSPKEAIKNNVFGTYNTLMSCIDHKVEKFILISTDKAVNPTNVMGASKRMCELVVQGYRNNGYTKIGAVRFGNVLGSNGSVIPLFEKQIKDGGPITVTHPDIIRYFMTIPEAAQLVLQAGVYANHGDIFILDMGEPVKILKLAEDLIVLSGLKPHDDIDIVFTGLRPGEKMFEELSLGNEERHKTANDLIFINEPLNILQDEIEDKLKQLIDLLENSTNSILREEIMEVIG
jgi:FlaA1/EpsC-like NDP-sugar epimerase